MNNLPFSFAFRELVFLKINKIRNEFYKSKGISKDEIATLTMYNASILTSFRFKNNDHVWCILKEEIIDQMSGNEGFPESVEELLIKSGVLEQLCESALMIAGFQDYDALYTATGYN